jgi:hypothetical protein
MLKEDVCLVQYHRRQLIPIGSVKEVSLLLSIGTLWVSGPAAAFGVAATAAVYGHWRFRKTRLAARRLTDLLPPQLSEGDYVDRFRQAFGVTPPMG